MLGDWMSRPTEAGLLARQIAIEMARAALAADRDVIVPQFLARVDFIGKLETLAVESGCAFIEIALTADRDDVLGWFRARSSNPETASHVDAEQLLERTGGTDELRRILDRWERLLASRPHVDTIPARVGDVDSTLEQFKRVLASSRPPDSHRRLRPGSVSGNA